MEEVWTVIPENKTFTKQVDKVHEERQKEKKRRNTGRTVLCVSVCFPSPLPKIGIVWIRCSLGVTLSGGRASPYVESVIGKLSIDGLQT